MCRTSPPPKPYTVTRRMSRRGRSTEGVRERGPHYFRTTGNVGRGVVERGNRGVTFSSDTDLDRQVRQ